MRNLTTLIAFVVCLAAGAPNAHADDATTIAAVKTAFDMVDAAFKRQDAEAVKSMMTADHIAITPYYDGPKTAAESLQTLPDLKLNEVRASKMTVSLLGPDAALVTFIADMDGTFLGIPVPSRGFVTSIMVRRGGRWLERLYQVTKLE